VDRADLAASPELLGSPDVLVNHSAVGLVPGLTRTRDPLEVHRRLPGYAPTPLVPCLGLAADLGVGELWVKDESSRLGLPAFKMLGASYACYQVLVEKLGYEPEWTSIDELAAAVAALGRLTFCAATDGNHGRAVARMARLLGMDALIYIPDGIAKARVDAIAGEGAEVIVTPGGYDAAVAESARKASDSCIVLSDTSWTGYTEIPRLVIEGYSTIFAEVGEQLADAGGEPDIVVIPVGVGALAAATITHFKAAGESVAGQAAKAGSGPGRPAPRLLGVEPESARCVLESLRAGEPVMLPFPQTSIMAGLNCGTPSPLAWPLLERGLDVMAAVSDEWAMVAMRSLAEAGVLAGETGAAALAGLLAICADPAGEPARSALGLCSDSRVLVLCTEGVTDAAAWAAITGRPVPAGPRPPLQEF
jgi:diaminopropionate ammonia-lyase